MNIKLLRQIKRIILKRPRQFVMYDVFSDYTEFDAKPSHCGTAACVAGWAITLGQKHKNPREAWEAYLPEGRLNTAQDLLGLNFAQRERLFLRDMWPQKFQPSLNTTHPQFTRLAAARIEHFIKTKGRE